MSENQSWNLGPQQMPRKRRNWPWIVLAVFVALLCGFGGVALLATSNDDKGVLTPGPVSSAARGFAERAASNAPTPRPAKSVPAEITAHSIAEGTWKVGADVKPGQYFTAGAEESIITLCYWEVRDESETGAIKAQGATDQLTAKEYVTLKKGQYFKTSGCKPWTLN